MSTILETTDKLAEIVNAGCPNCPCDGCFGVRYCDGCDQLICVGCWDEHNNDAPCHCCGEHSERDAEGNLTEKGCGC